MNSDNKTPVCLITGASNGIGRVTARRMAEAGYAVIVSGRDENQLDATTRDLGSRAAGSMTADLSELAGVHRLADYVADRHDRLDVLINNAGLTTNQRRLSADGFELTWAVNYLAPFLLTHLLLERLRSSTPSRVVNVTSAAQGFGRLDFDDLQFERRPYQGLGAYAQSKLALLMFTIELANRLDGSGVTVNCVHPGGANSNLGRDVGSGPGAKVIGGLMSLLNNSPEHAAEAQVYLATSPDVADLTGAYLINRTPPRPGRANRLARDTDARRRLWDISLAMTALRAT
jgi:NAD(P)-dependent dehydrogenase (short-subunit alcohol dehydrogenase family)